MIKYGIFDFLYVHQVVASLARTGILFQNNLNILKLLIIILISMFDNISCIPWLLSDISQN